MFRQGTSTTSLTTSFFPRAFGQFHCPSYSIRLNSLPLARYLTVPLLEHSPKVVAAIQNETSVYVITFQIHRISLTYRQFWGKALSDKGGIVGYTIEPFVPSILSHNTTPTAYPPTRDHVYFPLGILFIWINATYDNDFYDAIRQSAVRIRDVAIGDGQDIIDAPLYPNYAIFGTPLKDMYGANVDKLHRLKRRVDPDGVMGLTGGFRF